MLQDSIKTVHFDLDGTLIDSVPDLTLAVADMCRRFGLQVYDEADIRRWVGNGSEMLVRRALCGCDRPDTSAVDASFFAQAHAYFLDAYDKHLCEATRPFEGVLDTLESLKKAGYKLSIITNKPTRFLPSLLKRLRMEEYFDAVVGGDSYATKKPDPLPLIETSKRLGVLIDEALMVGDSRNDLLAAQRCGMRSIGVTYGYSQGIDLSTYAPVALIDRFDTLRTFLLPKECVCIPLP